MGTLASEPFAIQHFVAQFAGEAFDEPVDCQAR
jgi:hypothetical protein